MPSLSLRSRFRTGVLALWHLLLRTLTPRRASTSQEQPKRILLMNGAHIGDVVIASSLLPVLKSAYPKAEIGFLAGSWAQPVVQSHPDIRYTHCVDHWRMNRSAAGFFQKRLHYWKTRRRALQDIRALAYDVAVCMHPWRADFLPLTWQAAIPVRAAFSGGLFAPLATVLADYPEPLRFIHQGDCQLKLLCALGIKEEHLRLRRSSLAPSSSRAVSEVCHLLGFARIDEAPYSVIHMGSGNPVKELPATFWREVATRLAPGQQVLFTGKSAREWSNAAEATAGLAHCVNACDHLSWEGFVAAIRFAQSFYGVDSMAAHVAAAVGTRCVAVYGGMTNLARFRPDSANSVVWANALPCSSCDLQFGCAEMTCMRGFDASQIVQIAAPQIQKARAS